MTRYFGAHTLQGEWHSLLPRYVLLEDRIDGKQILDIGCGTGIGSSLLLEMGAASVNGIDHRPEVIELARVKHAKQGLNFQVMFWEELDFADNTFDQVLCLDPTSPVTDPSLLGEVRRVLRPGGEYICAIERRNTEGFEALLPRYGYDTAGKEVELNRSGERVPQLGELEEMFATIVTVVQRPRYSFVFDVPADRAEQPSRHKSADPAASGLWVGPDSEREKPEATEGNAGRWIADDDRLAGDDEPAAIELLFCGGDQMPAPTLREVKMPQRELVERLRQLFSELQLRSHPTGDADDAQGGDANTEFDERQKTTEFETVSSRRNPERSSGPSASHQAPPGGERASSFDQTDRSVQAWQQVHRQLDQMTRMYRQIRDEMETLFVRTRRELAERDQYIEQLVDTVHRWKHELERQSSDADPGEPVASPDGDEQDSPPDDPETRPFEQEPTNIFERPSALADDSPESTDMEEATTIRLPDDLSPGDEPDDAPKHSDSATAEDSEAHQHDGDADAATHPPETNDVDTADEPGEPEESAETADGDDAAGPDETPADTVTDEDDDPDQPQQTEQTVQSGDSSGAG